MASFVGRGVLGGGGLWLGLAMIVDRGSPPFFLPPPLTAWLQHTAVTRIHLCHLPTVGLMSSPVKPLKHSTWASPTPGPEAQGLPQRVPRLPLILHKALGRPTPAVLVVTGSWEHHPDSRTENMWRRPGSGRTSKRSLPRTARAQGGSRWSASCPGDSASWTVHSWSP